MSQSEMAIFNQAVQLAQIGQTKAAYQLFAALSWKDHNNPGLLLWIAHTTPDNAEARRALDHVAWLDPNHPALPAANAHWIQRERNRYRKTSSGASTMSNRKAFFLVGLFVVIQLGLSLIPLLFLSQFKPFSYTHTRVYPAVEEVASTSTPVAATATPLPSQSNDSYYADPDKARVALAPGSTAWLRIDRLEKFDLSDSQSDYYLWKSHIDSHKGVVLKFAKGGLAPAVGEASYRVKIEQRVATTADLNAYLYVRVEEVKAG
jgi:hypothetical protein